MGVENARLIDDMRDPTSDVYDDEVSQGNLIKEDQEPEIYDGEQDLRRHAPHK